MDLLQRIKCVVDAVITALLGVQNTPVRQTDHQLASSALLDVIEFGCDLQPGRTDGDCGLRIHGQTIGSAP